MQEESVIGCDRGHYLRRLVLIFCWKTLQLPTILNKELLSKKGDTLSLAGDALTPRTSFLFSQSPDTKLQEMSSSSGPLLTVENWSHNQTKSTDISFLVNHQCVGGGNHPHTDIHIHVDPLQISVYVFLCVHTFINCI